MIGILPKPGDTITSKELTRTFQCSGQGGMRRSLKTNTLLIISKHFNKLYEDRWQDDTLHYTGMGQTGDQSLDFMQNPTLHRHKELGATLHLFEQFKVGEYRYQGQVYLADNPYREVQPDQNGNDRWVWMFPLKLTGGEPIPEPQQQYLERRERRERKAIRLSDSELSERARKARTKPGRKTVLGYQHERDENVAAYAKRRAQGVCELCEQSAPFRKKDGKPYLESHHIVWLSEGGGDSISNTVALCPNCHRKMHSLNLKVDIQKLKIKASKELI